MNNLALNAKKRLQETVVKMDKRLENCWQIELERNFGFDKSQKQLVKKMVKHAREHNLRSGKRLRGSLVLAGYELSAKVDEKIWDVAMGIELIHTALLIHDDFMDQDELRRGKPTTHLLWADGDLHYGASMAINIGNAVLMMGFELIAKSEFEPKLKNIVLTNVLRGITNTTWGQAYDVSVSRIGLKTSNVMALHKAKTALYTYENPLLAGAVLGGVSKRVIQKLKKYAEDGGVAFQLQDDILGVFGETKTTGKSDNSDIKQGKVTTLITEMLEKLNTDEYKTVMSVWGNKLATNNEIKLVKKLIKSSGAYDKSKMDAIYLAQRAANTARDLRKLKVQTTAIDYLEGIALYMVERDV